MMELIKALRQNVQPMPQVLSQELQQKKNDILSKFGEREKFLSEFNPDSQLIICNDTRLCILGDTPTLSEMNMAYGAKTAVIWLIPQLYDLSEYCGCKEKLEGKQLEQCAYVIASEFYYLKVTEFMLFFHRFKAGRYDKMYGFVDPLAITRSIRQFVSERNYEIDKYENEKKLTKLNEDLANYRNNR